MSSPRFQQGSKRPAELVTMPCVHGIAQKSPLCAPKDVHQDNAVSVAEWLATGQCRIMPSTNIIDERAHRGACPALQMQLHDDVLLPAQ